VLYHARDRGQRSDYHRLNGGAVHEHVEYLLTNLPATLRLVIVTRSDPPLALGRLRSEHEVCEVRADDLRFSVDEAQTLLNTRLGLGIDRHDVARLVKRTEGWVAGLSLAALSLRDRHDKAAFMREFTGTERHLVDYLGSEVLSRLPDELRSFLVRTSILGSLSGPLCDVVLDRHGST